MKAVKSKVVFLIEKVKCTGCMACVQSCPRSCIRIEKDQFGNLYPAILEISCIQCGKCDQVCPEHYPVPKRVPQHAWAAWSLDADTRRKAASGGAASEFYRQALQDGWWICGTAWQADFKAVHELSKDFDAIERFRNSKYVFSDCSDAYSEIAELLKSGERVLFISLPCKVAGLLKFLGGGHKNLLTVDIVCHGTPSHQMLKEHIAAVDPYHEATALSFRIDNTFAFHLKNGTRTVYRKVGRMDLYLASFLEGLSYRPSCYRCSYADNGRVSDLTICDFWGLGKEIPFDHPYIGAVSAVLVNTPAGESFWNRCKQAFFFEERPVREAIAGNAQLNFPTPIHPRQAIFESLYKNCGFEKAVSKILKREIVTEQIKIVRISIRRKLRHVAGILIKRYRG